MGELLPREPPWKYTPQTPRTIEIQPGQVLARVFDRIRAATYRFGPMDFSHHHPPANAGGRFDASAEDPYGYIYCAETQHGALVAIYEAVIRDRVFSTDAGAFVIAAAEVCNRSLMYFTSDVTLKLADLTSATALAKYGATTDLISSRNYYQTRKWARYIRQASLDVSGIAWTSRPTGVGTSIVLFEDRLAGRPLRPLGTPIDLCGEGRAILDAALVDCNAVIA